MSELTERLRGMARKYGSDAVKRSWLESADALEAQEARIRTLESALKPFAQVAEDESMMDETDKDTDEWFRWDGSVLLVGDFRAALSALTPSLPK